MARSIKRVTAFFVKKQDQLQIERYRSTDEEDLDSRID